MCHPIPEFTPRCAISGSHGVSHFAAGHCSIFAEVRHKWHPPALTTRHWPCCSSIAFTQGCAISCNKHHRAASIAEVQCSHVIPEFTPRCTISGTHEVSHLAVIRGRIYQHSQLATGHVVHPWR